MVFFADSKNLYFAPGYQEDKALTIVISENQVYSLGKGVSDTTTMSEEAILNTSKALADSPTLSEVFSRLVAYSRDFSDTPTITESLGYLLGKALAETPTISETHATNVGKPLSDSANIGENYVSDFGRNPSDTVTMSENYADVITFVRAFADGYALDDTASASDALATESGVNNNNIVNVSEALNFILNLGPTDSATVSEV